MLTQIPNGLDEIIFTFGGIDAKDFEATHLVSFDLPYPLVYDGMLVHRTRCHHLAVENFQGAFIAIKNEGLEAGATNFGGIYNQRAMRGHPSHPSTHSWGIAIDLEPAKYPLGSDKRFPDKIVEIFRRQGFMYGVDFKSRKDPMHFQLATGY